MNFHERPCNKSLTITNSDIRTMCTVQCTVYMKDIVKKNIQAAKNNFFLLYTKENATGPKILYVLGIRVKPFS